MNDCDEDTYKPNPTEMRLQNQFNSDMIILYNKYNVSENPISFNQLLKNWINANEYELYSIR